MPKLTDQEKAANARQRMIDKAKAYSTGTYIRKFVAPLFQRMIRAEAGANPRLYVLAVVDGQIRQVPRMLGEVACVTCGDVYPWTHQRKLINTGHFLGRGHSIIFEEHNVAPQCALCNDQGYGRRDRFRLWVTAIYGAEEVERLERLKPQTRQFTREELVDLRIQFAARLKAAERKMSWSR